MFFVPLVSGMDKEVYVCIGSESLDCLFYEAVTMGYFVDDLKDRFPGLSQIPLFGKTRDGGWNVFLGIERKRIHILAYDYHNENACVHEGSVVIQKRKLKNTIRGLPKKLLGQYVQNEEVVFDRFRDGKTIPTRVICDGPMIVVVNKSYQPDLAEQILKYVREVGAEPVVLHETERFQLPKLDKLVDDSWRESL